MLIHWVSQQYKGKSILGRSKTNPTYVQDIELKSSLLPRSHSALELIRKLGSRCEFHGHFLHLLKLQ